MAIKLNTETVIVAAIAAAVVERVDADGNPKKPVLSAGYLGEYQQILEVGFVRAGDDGKAYLHEVLHKIPFEQNVFDQTPENLAVFAHAALVLGPCVVALGYKKTVAEKVRAISEFEVVAEEPGLSALWAALATVYKLQIDRVTYTRGMEEIQKFVKEVESAK